MSRYTIYLYDDGASFTNVNLPPLVNYLESMSGQEVIRKKSPVMEAIEKATPESKKESLDYAASTFAGCRLREPANRCRHTEPLPAEVEYEKKRLAGGRATGLYYEGLEIQSYYSGLISAGELGEQYIHIVITNQLLASWEPNDSRYHARVVILGYPSLISIGGLVEGPAKPREYYVERQIFSSLGAPHIAPGRAKRSDQRRYLHHGDERLTEVLKGPLAQALFYHIFGEVFCQDKGCRLFNARWQEELIFAQLGSSYEFCHVHTEMLRALRSN